MASQIRACGSNDESSTFDEVKDHYMKKCLTCIIFPKVYISRRRMSDENKVARIYCKHGSIQTPTFGFPVKNATFTIEGKGVGTSLLPPPAFCED